mmetsp:Transcript_54650/g.124458  ORF Transcript_54650/g.124458 Transcript_54650/m.124458 type:complete len:90 (-) Transcript_54650:73-342(-)
MYYQGRGVRQSYKEALVWFRMVAEKGHVNAQCNLGIMYRQGYGVPKNTTKALAWYQKAAACEWHSTTRKLLATRGPRQPRPHARHHGLS